MSDADCTPGRESRSVAASILFRLKLIAFSTYQSSVNERRCRRRHNHIITRRHAKDNDNSLLLHRHAWNAIRRRWLVHRDSKNVPHLACSNFDTCERILIFFGRNVTDKVGNQKALYYVPLQINPCFCTTSQNAELEKCIFHSYAVLVHCLNSTSCLISSIFLTHDSRHTKSCNQCIQLAAVVGAWFRINEVKSAAEVGLCCTHNAPVHCLLDFLFRKVMEKHWIGEVGKQSIVWFLTFSVTLLPNIIVIGLCMSRL